MSQIKLQDKTAQIMERRNFVKTISIGSLTAVALGTSTSASTLHAATSGYGTMVQPTKKVLMKVGCLPFAPELRWNHKSQVPEHPAWKESRTRQGD